MVLCENLFIAERTQDDPWCLVLRILSNFITNHVLDNTRICRIGKYKKNNRCYYFSSTTKNWFEAQVSKVRLQVGYQTNVLISIDIGITFLYTKHWRIVHELTLSLFKTVSECYISNVHLTWQLLKKNIFNSQDLRFYISLWQLLNYTY